MSRPMSPAQRRVFEQLLAISREVGDDKTVAAIEARLAEEPGPTL